MASIRDHVRGFLAEFPSPKETDIQKFAEEIASKDSSLDKESFKAKLLKVILQRAIIRQYENRLSYISRDSPVFKEFEKVLKEARMAHENLEDISSDLKTARELLGSFIGKNKEGQVSVDKSHQDHEAIKSIPATERSSKENISYTAHSVPEIKPEVPGKPKEEKVIPESEPAEIKAEVSGKPTVETVIPENEPAEAEPEVEKPAENQVITENEPHAPEIKQEIPEKPTVETVITENEPAETEPEVPGKPAEDQVITEIEPPAPEIKQEIHEKPTVETVITENEPAETEPEVPGKPKEEKAIPESEPPAPEIKPEVHEKPKEERAIPESEPLAPEIKPEVAEKPAEEQAIPESEPAEKKQEVSDKPLEETVISESEDSEKLSDEMELSDDNVDEPETREKPETKEEIETQDIKPARKEKKGRKKKDDIEIQIEDQGASLEGAEELMSRLNMDDTRVLLRERLSPEKQAVFELLEEKLMSDVETRIKKLKEMQTKVLEETPPQTYFGKIKVFFTKEAESIEAYDPQLHGPLVTFDGMEGFTEVERYWVNEPYAFVVILFDPENNTYLYYAAEPMLTEFEDLFLREIKDRLKDVLLVEDVRIEDDKDKILTNKVRQLIKDYAIEINPLTLEKVDR